MQNELLESVWKRLIAVKEFKITGPALFRINSVTILARTVMRDFLLTNIPTMTGPSGNCVFWQHNSVSAIRIYLLLVEKGLSLIILDTTVLDMLQIERLRATGSEFMTAAVKHYLEVPETHCFQRGLINNVCKMGALWKATLRKVQFSGDFLGGFDPLRCLFSKNYSTGPLELNKTTYFYKTLHGYACRFSLWKKFEIMLENCVWNCGRKTVKSVGE